MASLTTSLRKRVTGRILKSLAVFGSVELMSMACNVIRTKLIALWVGAAGVGLMGLFSTALDMLSQLTQLSLRTVTVREIAAAPSDEKRRSLSRSVALYGALMAAVGMAVTVLLAPLLSYLTFDSLGYTWTFAAIAIAVAANAYVSVESSILQGHNMLKRIAAASFIGVPASLAVAIPMIYFWRIHSIIPIILTYVCIMAIVMWCLRIRSNAPCSPIKGKERRRLWSGFARMGFYLSVASVFSLGASYLLMSFLNHNAGTDEMGLYQAGYSLSVRYIGIIFPAMAMEYYPRLSGVDSKWRTTVMMSRQTSVSIFVIAPCAMAMMLLAPWIVELLYSSHFIAAVPMIIFAAVGLPMRAWAWAMGFVLLARGNGRIYLVTEILSAAIGLIVNIAGYSLGGLTGLGLSFIIWYAADCLIEAVALRRYYSVNTAPKVVLSVLGSSLILGILSAVIFYW